MCHACLSLIQAAKLRGTKASMQTCSQALSGFILARDNNNGCIIHAESPHAPLDMHRACLDASIR